MSSRDSVYCNTNVPPEVWKRWRRTVDWVRHVMATENTSCQIIELHWHPDLWRLGCNFMGMCNTDVSEIHLCGHKAPSKATVLHEIAHDLSGDGHGRGWAEQLLTLNRRWLPQRLAIRSNRSHARTYRSVGALWRKVSGEHILFTGSPGHSDVKSVERHHFRNRSRYAQARRALRSHGPWRAWYE